MPKFYCINHECELNGEIRTESRARYVHRGGSVKTINPETGDPFTCKKCGNVLTEVEEDKGICTAVGKWSQMPDRDKKKILKKRFDEDYKKNGREEKEWRKSNLINKMKNG